MTTDYKDNNSEWANMVDELDKSFITLHPDSDNNNNIHTSFVKKSPSLSSLSPNGPLPSSMLEVLENSKTLMCSGGVLCTLGGASLLLKSGIGISIVTASATTIVVGVGLHFVLSAGIGGYLYYNCC